MAVGLLDIPPPLLERDHVVVTRVVYCVVAPKGSLNTILPLMPCAMSVLLSLRKVFKTFAQCLLSLVSLPLANC